MSERARRADVRIVVMRRQPAFERDSWIPPTASEEEERVDILQRRFSQSTRSAIADRLREFRGHGGYAAHALIQAGALERREECS
jgi:hypothetical protein